MLKLTFYVPVESKEAVKNALFQAGAGTIGNYDMCSFETPGTGQFRALKGANPAIGEVGTLELVEEVKVEMVIADKFLKAVIEALKSSHPYETPAYDVVQCLEV